MLTFKVTFQTMKANFQMETNALINLHLLGPLLKVSNGYDQNMRNSRLFVMLKKKKEDICVLKILHMLVMFMMLQKKKRYIHALKILYMLCACFRVQAF